MERKIAEAGRGGKRQQLARLASRALASNFGEEAAAQELAKVERQWSAAEAIRERQQTAQRMGRGRERQGEGAELEADNAPHKPRKAEVSRSKRATKRLGQLLQAKRKREGVEAEQAARLSARVLEQHGIRHHFRPVCSVAWFAAYLAGLDKNGTLALQILHSLNIPRERLERVLEAAYHPEGYTPYRDVCTGERADQERFRHDGSELAERDEDHPGAVRVIQCFIFLWLAKTTTRRKGYSHTVRGFGRGLFEQMTRSGKDAITGHFDGVPGALVALKQAGAIQYGQPPATVVADVDRGPSGHAYNMFWFAKLPEERALDELHEAVREAAQLPLIVRLVETPDAVWELLEPRRPKPPD